MEVTKTVESAVENKGNVMFTHLFSCSHAHTCAHTRTHVLTYMHTSHRQSARTRHVWILFIPGPLVTNVVLLTYQTVLPSPFME